MNNNFFAFVPTRVIFGAGELNNLHKQIFPGKKALLIISNGKATKENGYLGRTEIELKKANIEYSIFDRVEPNPLKGTVMEGAKSARQNHCDFIVALGGGSVMDAAKAIATMSTNDGDVWDYVNGGTGKGKKIENKPLEIVAITTTAGTGSEVDAWGVITNDKTHEKIGFGGIDGLFPTLAIVDPELTVSVPPKFTAYQGFDALFHSTEVYISKFANLMSDMTAVTAIEAVSGNLASAVINGSDLQARAMVMFGNTISGYAMVYGCTTSEHSLEHAMSAFHQQLPHGAGLIMISKAYYEHFIDKHVCDERFIKMARIMGIKNAEKAEDFITALVNLQKECGVENLKMSDYGIKKDEFHAMAKNALETMGGLFESDRLPLSIEDCVAIYEKSFR